MVFDHQATTPPSGTIESIAAKLPINDENLRQWVRRAETDAGERCRMKELKGELRSAPGQ
jgi:transposase-like protein